MSNKNKTIISITILAIIALIVIVGLLIWKGLPNTNDETKQKENTEKQTEEDKKSFQKTKDLIDEIREIAKDIENRDGGISEIVVVTGENEEKKAVIIAPGASPISVETGDVLTSEGEVAKNNVKPGSKEAPKSSFVVNPEDLSASTIKINVTWQNITPAEFKVKPGQAVSLAVTAGERSHTVIFEDPSLSAVVVSLAPKQTKTISFNAPANPGEYLFFSDIQLYREAGSVGKMIVE